jgi:aminomethyltransferase
LRNIALAMIKPEHLKGDIWAEIYFSKELRSYKKIAKCKVQTKPFWAPARAKATPPPDL